MKMTNPKRIIFVLLMTITWMVKNDSNDPSPSLKDLNRMKEHKSIKDRTDKTIKDAVNISTARIQFRFRTKKELNKTLFKEIKRTKRLN